MSIITISKGSEPEGQIVAQQVAERLGYRCFEPELIEEAAKRFRISGSKLTQVLEETPGIWERFTRSRRNYLIFIQAAMCELARRDHMVYHGSGGQQLLRGIPHVLKVRIIVPIARRVDWLVTQQGLIPEEAAKQVHAKDAEKTQRLRYLFDIDWNDPSLYDMVINLDRISVSSAVEEISGMVSRPEFQKTSESQQIIENLALASLVKATLAANERTNKALVAVAAQSGTVTMSGAVFSEASKEEILEVVRQVEGVVAVQDLLEISVIPTPEFMG
ncbi:MAG TPA: cytidylate kinase family protein [bacterium]|nr:cytidylate kinase family protein [bacterium]